jgi:hypothetical protein
MMAMTPTRRRNRHRKPPPETEEQRYARQLDYIAKLRRWLESPVETDHPVVPNGLI